MPTNETDRILKAMLREFKEIRSELHKLNRNMLDLERIVQFHAVMTCDVSNKDKVEMLETMKLEMLNEEKPGHTKGE